MKSEIETAIAHSVAVCTRCRTEKRVLRGTWQRIEVRGPLTPLCFNCGKPAESIAIPFELTEGL